MPAVPDMSSSDKAGEGDAVERLAAAVAGGALAALARAITLVENARPGAEALLAKLRPHLKGGLVVGFTGPPGAGKSTLINALICEMRAAERRVAVLAVDPSSPLSGGALLGDRARMGVHSVDPGVFIRSLSARGHLGGLSAAVFDILDLVDAAGWDVTLVETVGAGQSETEIAAVADLKVVILAPGLGDDLQAIKAGILEIADIIVVNKADREGADETARQLRAMLGLRAAAARRVEVLKTVATSPAGVSNGIAELLAAIDGHAGPAAPPRARRLARSRAALAGLAGDLVRRALLEEDDRDLDAVLAKVLDGDLSLQAAAPKILGYVARQFR